MTIKGIDVSKHQGTIDWTKVKSSGVQFVILRAGFGKVATQKDTQFENNYKGAKAAGLPVGIYWYSYATTQADAKLEAQVCLSIIKGKTFEYPIYFDLEERKAFDTGKANCSAMVRAFCGEIEKAGYTAGLYMSRSPFNSYIEDSLKNTYALWLAEYNTKLNYSGPVGMWQYSSTGKINGISGNVDMDYCYVDYAAQSKGKTTSSSTSAAKQPAKSTSTGKKSVATIAQEVIDGKWGNGDDRKKKLTDAGYDYNAVQKKVNELVKTKKSIDVIAQEVIDGKWGNGDDRKKKLTAAGYDYAAVQKKVNALLKK